MASVTCLGYILWGSAPDSKRVAVGHCLTGWKYLFLTFTVSVSWTLKNYDRTSRPRYVLFYSGWSARKTLQELRGVVTVGGEEG